MSSPPAPPLTSHPLDRRNRLRATPWVPVGLVLLAFLILDSYSASAATLLVSTTHDAVNGDISSPASLLTRPGPDGISLREAIEATNRAPGPHTIAFAPQLSGLAIELRDVLPPLQQDRVAIEGLRDSQGGPDITLDASRVVNPDGAVISILASHVSLRHLRIQDVPLVTAVLIEAGDAAHGLRSTVESVLLESCVFSNLGVQAPPGFGPKGVHVSTAPTGVGSVLRDVVLRSNRFEGYLGDNDAILAGAGGRDSRLEHLTIEGNVISDSTFGVEVGAGSGGGGDQVSGTRIVSNRFTRVHLPIVLGAGGEGRSSLRDTVIADNSLMQSDSVGIEAIVVDTHATLEDLLIQGNQLDSVIHVAALGRNGEVARVVVERNRHAANGTFVSFVGGESPASVSNYVHDIRVTNNAATGRINIAGGIGSAHGNRVEGVLIANNTLVVQEGPALSVYLNDTGGTANSVGDVEVINTILYAPSGDFLGEVIPAQVRFSRTSAPGFAGINGNISGEPLFVNSAAGDFRLRPGSPAIDAGTSDAAPLVDLDGKGRVDAPAHPNTGGGDLPFFDMGAYEHLPDGGGAVCDTTSTSLCLASSRFRIQASWKSGDGIGGQAQAVPLTPDTGYFWFFARSNIEIVTKILDACGVGSAPRFWLFAAGLTNVEVALTVTDTKTAQVKTYTNPGDRPFQPLQDTDAFATCP